MKVRRIYILVLKSYLGPLVLTFFISLFILLMQFLWKYVDDLVGKGLEWYIITELLFYAAATFVPLALPLAILLSSLMTFGNLGEHYELVAMKASGISLRKIMAPLVVLSIIISISAFYFSNNILPLANLKFHSILYDVRQQRLALNIKEGVFYKGIDDFVIRVDKKDDNGVDMEGIMIYDHREQNGNVNLTMAERGRMEITPDQKYLIFTLYNGYNYKEEVDNRRKMTTRPFQRIHFKEEMRRFDLGGFQLNRTDEALFRNNYHMYNLRQLRYAGDSLLTELAGRRWDAANGLDRHYSHYNMSRAQDTVYPDTMSGMGWDSLFQSLPLERRERAMETALSSSRGLREWVVGTEDDLSRREKRIIKHHLEWHRKFTLSFACLVLFFIGAPLGAIIRKGGLGLPVVVSTFLFVFFHILSITGEKFAREGVLEPWQGMWLASAVLLPLGVFLTARATADAPIMDADIWRRRISALQSLLQKKKQRDEDSVNM
ncbi:MAG TPA: LptF/LptG family permease [Bacteroidales bacterium]|nr:LptF/LptG family permease [Lentimicrobiaceae bacterium]HOI00142.1 LptF/LptG family permease [Bacteroidales bacterium]